MVYEEEKDDDPPAKRHKRTYDSENSNKFYLCNGFNVYQCLYIHINKYMRYEREENQFKLLILYITKKLKYNSCIPVIKIEHIGRM